MLCIYASNRDEALVYIRALSEVHFLWAATEGVGALSSKGSALRSVGIGHTLSNDEKPGSTRAFGYKFIEML